MGAMRNAMKGASLRMAHMRWSGFLAPLAPPPTTATLCVHLQEKWYIGSG